MNHPIGNLAHDLVKRYGVHDPFKIAEGLATDWAATKGNKGLRIKVFVTDLGGLKGFCCIITDVFCIFINENLSQEMKTMVCAHELGHCLLHTDNLQAGFKYSEYNLSLNLNRAEYEANAFTAFLLIDDSDMLDCLYSGWDFFETAKYLYIDVNYLAIRLMECPPPELRIDIPIDMTSSFLKYIDNGSDSISIDD